MHVRPFGLATAVVLLAASVAHAERVDGKLQEKAALPGHYLFTLEGGATYTVPLEVYDRHKKRLEALNPGDVVEMEVGADKKTVSEFYFANDTASISSVMREGAFERYDDKSTPPRVWLDGGQNFAVEVARLDKDAKEVLFFIKKGQRIRVEIEGDRVIDVAKGLAKGEEEKKEVTELLEFSVNGDAPIQVRTKKASLNAKLVSKHASRIVISLVVPGVNPPRFQGRLEVRRSDIEEYINPLAAERREKARRKGGGGDGEKKADPFDAAGSVVGDTIGIGFGSGQLVQLTEDTYTLCEWRNGRWESDPKPKPRASATLVRSEVLVSQSTVPLEGGDLELTLKRSRRQNPGKGDPNEPPQGLCFEVTLNHTVKDLILVDLKLQFNLSATPCMELKQKPDKVVSRDVAVPLFANQRQVIRHEVSDDGFLDGQLEVVVYPRNLVQISSKQARSHLIAAMGTSQDVAALGGVYQAAAVNGDPEMCALMVVRELQLRHELQNGSKDEAVKSHELHLRQALDAFGEVCTKFILDTLFEPDRQLKTWGFRQGQIVQLPLPPRERPQTYKRKLIDLLATLPRGMEKDAGARLFDLYLRRADDFKEDLIAAYRRRPDEAVACLLSVAVDVKLRERAEKATMLLRELGQPILAAIFEALAKKGIDPTPFRDAVEKQGRPAEEVVAAAVDTLIKQEYARVKEELDDTVARAAGLRASRSFDEALGLIRGVLEREPNHQDALALLPDVLVDKALTLRDAGQRGAAALLLQEAGEQLKGPARAKSDVPMGELLIEATSEEVDSMVIKAAPHAASESVGPLAMGAMLDGEEGSNLGTEWLQVALPGGAKGYVRKGLVSPVSEGKWSVNQNETGYVTLKEQLDKAELLAPGSAPRAKEVLGRLSAREAKRRYDSGDFKNALAFFNTAAQYAPGDPRLELRWKCWIQSNTAPLIGVGAVFAFVVGIVLMQVFSRPNKVKFSGEYKHYGAERNVRERDLEVE